MIYTVILSSKNVSADSYDCDETIISTENREEAERVYNQTKADLTGIAEKEAVDLCLTLWSGEDEDNLYDDEQTDFCEYQGKQTDGMVALVIKPSYYHTPYQIISGEGHTERYFLDVPEDIRVSLIEASALTDQALRDFGFPEWYIRDFATPDASFH